jgi:hypothetical protein
MTKRNGWSTRKLTLLDVELELAIWLLKVAESKLKKKILFFCYGLHDLDLDSGWWF